MSLFAIPRRVRMGVEKIQKDFLWGDEALERSFLVKWATICIDRSKGGMGIRSLSSLN